MLDINRLQDILAKKAFENYYQEMEPPKVVGAYLRNLMHVNEAEVDDNFVDSCYRKYTNLYNGAPTKYFILH